MYTYSKQLYADIYSTHTVTFSVGHDLVNTYVNATSADSSVPIALKGKIIPDLLTRQQKLERGEELEACLCSKGRIHINPLMPIQVNDVLEVKAASVQ